MTHMPSWLEHSASVDIFTKWWRHADDKSGRSAADATEAGVTASHQPNLALLHRRMAVLGLDAEEVADTEPLIFGDFQKLCAACDSSQACRRGLADHSADPGWQCWRDYCPNASILSMLSALAACRWGPVERARLG